MPAEPLPDSLASTLAVFEDGTNPCVPLTTTEVADELAYNRRTVYNKLDELTTRGLLETKKVGARGRVWWRPNRLREGASGDGERESVPGADADGDATQFRSLVTAVEEYAIFRLDPDGHVASWNEGALRIKGYDREEIIGEHFSTFYTDADVADGVPEANLELARAETTAEDRGWRVRADGTRFWAEVTITAIRDDAGDLEGYAKVTRDMTEHRAYEQRVEAERNLLERILETSPVGVAVFSGDGETIEANAHAARYLGLPPESRDEYELGQADVLDEDGRPIPFEDRPVAQVLETGDPVFDRQVSVEDVDGRTRWLSVNAVPLAPGDRMDSEPVVDAVEEAAVVGGDGAGDDAVVVTLLDVTRLKEQSRQLRRERDELESELENVYERIDDAFFGVDEEWRFTYVNERAEALLQQSAAELVGRGVWDEFPEAIDSVFRERYETAMREQESVSFETYYEPLERWFEVTAYPSESGLSVFFRDVTGRKERERELERYEEVVETVNDGVYVLDEDDRFTLVNEALVSMTGYERAELRGSHGSLVFGESFEAVNESQGALLERGEIDVASFEEEILTAGGASLTVESRFRLFEGDDEQAGRVGVVRDITERVRNRRRLEESERRYRTLAENVPDGVVALFDESLRYTLVAGGLFDDWPLDPEEVVGKRVGRPHLTETQREAVLSAYRDALAGERSTFEFEARGRHFSAQTVPVRDGDGEVFSGMVISRDVTEQKRREQELLRYETIVDSLWDGVYALDPEDRFMMVNDEFLSMTGYDREALLGSHVTLVHGDDVNETAAREVADGDASAGTALEFELERADGGTTTVESRFGPYRYDDDRFARTGVVRDVTERRRYVETLTALHGSARRLLDAETKTAVSAVVADVVEEILDLPGVVVYRYDEAEGVLVPDAESTDATFMRVEFPAVTPEVDSITGSVFSDGRPHRFSDIMRSSRLGVDADETEMRSGLFVPVADQGIIVAGARDPDAFDDETQGLLELLSANAETAYLRVEREEQLRRQRERLDALNNLNRVVREVNEALVRQSTREEIEQVVCERLAEVDAYEFAYICEVDPKTMSVSPRVEAGVDSFLEAVPLSVNPAEPAGQGPLGRAVRSQETVAARGLRSNPEYELWHEYAERYGFEAAAAVPIVHEESLYGVLGLYTTRPDGFEATEREVIGQLGEVIGHAIAAVERKEALMSDELVEVSFRIEDVFGSQGAAVTTDERIVFEQTVSVGDGRYLIYGTADEAACEALAALVEEIDHWTGFSVVSEEYGTARFELEVDEPPIISTVAAHGGYVAETVIDDGDLTMTVQLPPRVEVRRVVDAVTEQYEGVEMATRRQVSRGEDSAGRVRETLVERLTPRQRATLEAAYYAGYFEWPRESSGEDVAESLGVSPPTFHQHVRLAEQQVFTALLGGP